MKVVRGAPLTGAIIGLVALICGSLAGLRTPRAAIADTLPTAAAPAAVASYIQAFNKHDLKAIAPLLGDNFVEIFPDGNYIGGKNAAMTALTSVFTGSPHVTMIVDHLVGDDATAAAQIGMQNQPPKGAAPAAQYAYFFSVQNGQIVGIAVYERGAQAQKEVGTQ
jgi:hypothetical protein